MFPQRVLVFRTVSDITKNYVELQLHIQKSSPASSCKPVETMVSGKLDDKSFTQISGRCSQYLFHSFT